MPSRPPRTSSGSGNPDRRPALDVRCNNGGVDAEALAVSEIARLIGGCPNLKAYISTNDKTPFTDGYIDVYSAIRQSKDDWSGRVSIQVKGRSRPTKKGSLAKFPIERTDLLGYQKDAGVLYFVVTVDPKTMRCTAYYALLSPFAIEAILNRHPSSKQRISVPLKAFPTNPASIERVVSLALKKRDERTSVGFDPFIFERLETLTVHTVDSLQLDGPVTLTSGTHDFALIATTVDGLSLPLSGELRLFPPSCEVQRLDEPVRSGGIAYDNALLRRTGDDSFKLEISDGLTLSVHARSGTLTANVNLTLQRTLAGRLKDIQFFTAMLDTKSIELGGHPTSFQIADADLNTWLQGHVESLVAMAELFDVLGVDPHLIDLEEITESQTRQLNALHRALVQGEEVHDPAGATARVLQQMGSWNLLLLKNPGSTVGTWTYVDPFAPTETRQLLWRATDVNDTESSEGTDNPTIPVTPYDVVASDQVGTVLNMRLDAIVDAYARIAEAPSTTGLANQRVIELISAADAIDVRRNVLLNAAAALNDWLIDQQPDEPHHRVNGWQIIARLNPLTNDQRSEIRQLRRQVARSGVDNIDHYELAFALLLDDDEELSDLVRHLPPERVEQVQKWPIWSLHDSRAKYPAKPQ